MKRRALQLPGTGPARAATRTRALKPEHARLAGYFNVDNGSGNIRGVYLQENDMARPIFEAWLAPFRDLGAGTMTIDDTTGTDHLGVVRLQRRDPARDAAAQTIARAAATGDPGAVMSCPERMSRSVAIDHKVFVFRSRPPPRAVSS